MFGNIERNIVGIFLCLAVSCKPPCLIKAVTPFPASVKLFCPYHTPYFFWNGEPKNYISVRERGEKRNKREFTESPKVEMCLN